MTTETIQAKRPFRPWVRVVIALVIMCALFAVVYFLYFYWSVSKNSQSSDNAYVKGDLTYIANKVVLMPSYVNIGAYVDEGTMVDTWATVGSCAQIGKNVHLSVKCFFHLFISFW